MNRKQRHSQKRGADGKNGLVSFQVGLRVEPKKTHARDDVHGHPKPVHDARPMGFGYDAAAQESDRRVVQTHGKFENQEGNVRQKDVRVVRVR